MSREDFISGIASDIQSKLPSTFESDQIKKKFGTLTPTNVVLLQELERFNNLIKKMSLSLVNLQKALAGEVGMSNELDELAKSLYNGQLPVMWRSLSPETLKSLGNWMIHFLRRFEQYTTWVKSQLDYTN